MTEQQLRDQLTRATEEVHGGPDLTTAIQRGRRRRRTARAGVALAAVAVVAVGGIGVRALLPEDSSAVVRDVPAASGPAPAEDFVAGTDFDETLVAVVAERLPQLPAPDDVYPSDGDTAGPIPDADFASAEDWQAAYTLDGREVLLITGSAAEPFSCDGLDTTAVADGQLCTQTYDSKGVVRHGTWLARPDGSSTGLLVSGPALDAGAVALLVQDPRLRFSGA